MCVAIIYGGFNRYTGIESEFNYNLNFFSGKEISKELLLCLSMQCSCESRALDLKDALDLFSSTREMNSIFGTLNLYCLNHHWNCHWHVSVSSVFYCNFG